jgi:hypothetical protein
MQRVGLGATQLLCWRLFHGLAQPGPPTPLRPTPAGTVADVQCLSADGVQCMSGVLCVMQQRCLAAHPKVLLPEGPRWVNCSGAAGHYDNPNHWCHRSKAAASEWGPAPANGGRKGKEAGEGREGGGGSVLVRQPTCYCPPCLSLLLLSACQLPA